MGIQFQAEASEIEGHALTCGHPNGVTEHRLPEWKDAWALITSELMLKTHAGALTVCGHDSCRANGILSVTAVEKDPSDRLKVSGNNGAAILASIGQPWAEYGSLDAGNMLESIRTALLRLRDGEQDGKQSEYLTGRLEQLGSIAGFAAERGRRVTWG